VTSSYRLCSPVDLFGFGVGWEGDVCLLEPEICCCEVKFSTRDTCHIEKAKLLLCLTKNHSMKRCGRVEV
jgi:hypothetical protein